MEVQLRQYQVEFRDKISRSLAIHKSVIGCAPGGTGKTKTFLNICDRAMNKGRTCLIVTERKKIFNQISEEADCIIIDADVKHLFVQPGKLFIAMSQTLVRRPSIIKQFNELELEPLIIWDECHISTPVKLINQIHYKLLIGFTATPHVRWAKHLPIIFKECIVAEQISWFIQNDYLCNYRHIERRKEGIENLQVRNGEFTEESQESFYGSNELYAGLVDDLRESTFNKCLIFCASIKHAEATYVELIEAGFSCSIVHSKREDETYQLACFMKLDKTNVCISVSSMSTGFDFADIDQIMMYRATQSLPLYLQMCFRANRKKPSMFFTLYDYGMNGTRHKPYFYDRDWKTLWHTDDKKKGKEKDKLGVSPVKTCPNCESLIPVGATICEWCKEELPSKEKELQEGILVDITEKHNALIGKRVSELSPPELKEFAMAKNKKSFAIRVAKAKTQTEPDYLERFCTEMGYKKSWLHHQNIPMEPIHFYDFVIK